MVPEQEVLDVFVVTEVSSMGSEKVTEMDESNDTDVFSFDGLVDAMVGEVVSDFYLFLQLGKTSKRVADQLIIYFVFSRMLVMMVTKLSRTLNYLLRNHRILLQIIPHHCHYLGLFHILEYPTKYQKEFLLSFK